LYTIFSFAQVGGGINDTNAAKWIEAGASHVIVTSFIFDKASGGISWDKLKSLVNAVGGKERVVIDLSCRRKANADGESSANDDASSSPYYVVADRWQRYTDVIVDESSLAELAEYCDEFLVHGVENEGKRCGVLEDLVKLLGEYSPIPVTYAGGVRTIDDLDRVKELGNGKVDLTIGSALDIFGGDMSYEEVVKWHKREEEEEKE
jgi:phosphoribosylformimino-5-aminoimidazole carboxamide ribotide isomerase